jgi:hypothetical protein
MGEMHSERGIFLRAINPWHSVYPFVGWMQKLVLVSSDKRGHDYLANEDQEEHTPTSLQSDYLSRGWRIVSVASGGFGKHGSSRFSFCWVVIEKEKK